MPPIFPSEMPVFYKTMYHLALILHKTERDNYIENDTSPNTHNASALSYLYSFLIIGIN